MILAKGKSIRWEADQSAHASHIRDLPGDVIEVKLVRGQKRKGVMRSERRHKMYSPKEAIKLKTSFYIKVLTEMGFDGDFVVAQLPWDGGSPDNSIRIDAKNRRMYYLNYNQRGNPKRYEKTLIETIQVGREYRIDYLIDAEENGRGTVHVFVDGESKVKLIGQVLYPPLDDKREPKIGLYSGDDDLPSNVPEFVVQFRDVTFYTTDTTADEMLKGQQPKPEEPKPIPEPEEPKPKPEPEPPIVEPEPEEPKPVPIDRSKEIEDLRSELNFMAESLSRARGVLNELENKT